MPRVAMSSFGPIAIVGLLWATSATAWADDPVEVTLDVSVPADAPALPALKVDDSYPSELDIEVGYSLSGGVYTNVQLDLRLPEWVTVALSSHDVGTFTFDACPYDSGTSGPRTCRWSASDLHVDNTGIAGTIVVKARLDRWRWIEHQPVVFSAGSSGTFTPSGGSQTTFATTTRPTFDGHADARTNVMWQTGFGLIPTGWVERPLSGGGFENGQRVVAAMRFTNHVTGSVPLWNVMATTTVGPAYEILEPFRIEDGAPWVDGVITLPPGPAGETEIVFGYNGSAPLATYQDSHFDSAMYYVDLYVPCSAFVDPDDLDFVVTQDLSWDERTWTGPDTFTATREHYASDLTIAHDTECGVGALLEKHNENWSPAPEGGLYLTGMSFTPPRGVARATDVLLVDDFPDDLTVHVFHTRPPSQFTLYGCDFVGRPSGDIDLAYFTAHLGECDVLADGEVYPPRGFGHIIAHAPEWGGTSAPLQPLSFRYEIGVPLDYLTLHPNPSGQQDNVVYAHARWTLENVTTIVEPNVEMSIDDDPWKARAPVVVLDGPLACPVQSASPDGATIVSPRAIAPANRVRTRFIPYSDHGSSSLVDPTFTVSVSHPLVRITQIEYTPTGNVRCMPLTLQTPTLPLTTPTPGPVTLVFDGVQNDYHCFDVWVTVEPARDGWTNNETFEVRGRLDGQDMNPAEYCHRTAAQLYTVSVGAELRVDVAPSCVGNGGDPAFDVTARNNGGIDFDAVSMRFPLPPDTTLRDVVADPDVTVTCVDVGGATVDCASPDVVAVIGAGFDLDAPDERRTMHVALSTSLVFGDFITGSATASTGNLTASSGASVPFAVEDCRYELAVRKVFDANGNGPDESDAPLPNWSFTLSPSGGGDTVATTDVDGVARFYVRAGTYQVTEQFPETGTSGVIWQAWKGDVTQQVSVPVDPRGPVTLTFANACSCAEQRCQEVASACTIDGCSYVDEVDCANEPLYHVSVRTAQGFAVVECRLDRSGQAPKLACDLPNPKLKSSCGGLQ